MGYDSLGVFRYVGALLFIRYALEVLVVLFVFF